MKIFDCSDSKSRPAHRSISGGPYNHILYGLKEFSRFYKSEFVDNVKDCDIIFTNDVYPPEILKIDKPKIKRMGGVFWQNHLQDRSDKFNQAAFQSDFVIFVSEFCKKSFIELLKNEPRQHCVIVNKADDRIFYPNKKMRDEEFAFSAGATNWKREEKRLNTLIEFAKNIKDRIYLIGECEETLPDNIIKFGYIDSYRNIAEILWRSSAFVNFSYKDAAPKMVCQASACGLPALYDNSGGIKEVAFCGVGIETNEEIKLEDKSPGIDMNKILEAYEFFMKSYETLDKMADKCTFNYSDMMKEYFETFKLFE